MDLAVVRTSATARRRVAELTRSCFAVRGYWPDKAWLMRVMLPVLLPEQRWRATEVRTRSSIGRSRRSGCVVKSGHWYGSTIARASRVHSHLQAASSCRPRGRHRVVHDEPIANIGIRRS